MYPDWRVEVALVKRVVKLRSIMPLLAASLLSLGIVAVEGAGGGLAAATAPL